LQQQAHQRILGRHVLVRAAPQRSGGKNMTDDEIIARAKSLGWNVEHTQTNRMLILFARDIEDRIRGQERALLDSALLSSEQGVLKERGGAGAAHYERGFVDGMSHQTKSSVDRAVNAMARKPLTDDEIAQLMFKCDVIVTGPTQFNFARAIERAHGIGGEA
jgi:hypothetical protein